MEKLFPFYQNVTISGLPGAGSSTLGKSLAKELGWDYFCGGDFMRSYAIEKGLFDKTAKVHHSAAVYDDDFDRQVDYQARRWASDKEHQVLEAWLSGFMTMHVPGTLRVLVYCSDDAVRIDRIVNRDEITVDEAKDHIFRREQDNLTKWQRLYAQEWREWVVDKGLYTKSEPVYFWHPKLYDLAIDTYTTNREETLNKVLEALKTKNKPE